jgi:hypothetical protein
MNQNTSLDCPSSTLASTGDKVCKRLREFVIVVTTHLVQVLPHRRWIERSWIACQFFRSTMSTVADLTLSTIEKHNIRREGSGDRWLKDTSLNVLFVAVLFFSLRKLYPRLMHGFGGRYVNSQVLE